MANTIVSLLILIIGAVIGSFQYMEVGWPIFLVAVLLAFLNYKKNPFKL